jgi:hypothetical protein
MWIQNKKDEDTLSQPNMVNSPTVGAGGGAEVGESTSPATGNFSTTSPVATQQPVQKWATAQDYLKANQPQAAQLGQKVEKDLTGKLGAQKGAIDTAVQSAQKDITSGSTAFNPELLKTTIEKPTEITSSPTKLQDFLSQWNASYKGPESFESTESYNPAVQAASKAKEISSEITTPGGRNQLLQNQFGVYGAGNQALDTSLLGQAGNYQQIQNLAPKFAGLQDYLGQQSGTVNTAAEQAKADTAETQQKTREGVNTKVNQITADLDAKLANKITDTTTRYNAIQSFIQNSLGNLDNPTFNQTTGKELADLGVGASDIRNLTTQLQNLKNDFGMTFNPESYLPKANPTLGMDYGSLGEGATLENLKAFQQLTGKSDLAKYLDQSTGAPSTAELPKFNLEELQRKTSSADAKAGADLWNKYVESTQKPENPGLTEKEWQSLANWSERYANSPTVQTADMRKTIQDVLANTGQTPTAPVELPAGKGEVRVNPTSKKTEYYDGSKWVEAPQETKRVRNADGSTTYLKFNYTTGQYEEAQPGTGVYQIF